jgi:hypothetical protein
LCPGDVARLQGGTPHERLAHYFLDVADTDAVAVVADDDALSTFVLDIYDANDPDRPTPLARPLADAVATYFLENVFAVELPNFRQVLALPSGPELHDRVERSVRASFERIRAARVRVPEQIAALEALGPEDARRLVACVGGVLDGDLPSISELLGRVEGEDS